MDVGLGPFEREALHRGLPDNMACTHPFGKSGIWSVSYSALQLLVVLHEVVMHSAR
jgi:hypothetical protein